MVKHESEVLGQQKSRGPAAIRGSPPSFPATGTAATPGHGSRDPRQQSAPVAETTTANSNNNSKTRRCYSVNKPWKDWRAAQGAKGQHKRHDRSLSVWRDVWTGDEKTCLSQRYEDVTRKDRPGKDVGAHYQLLEASTYVALTPRK